MEKAREFAERRNLTIGKSNFGFGVHGTVIEVCRQSGLDRSAIKVVERSDACIRERDVYLRLYEHSVEDVCGHAVPQLLDYDDDLLVIQMTIVTPPFVLDFGGAWLDAPPDYPPEVLAEWEAEKREQFEDRWSDVVTILHAFRRFGIYISDVNPGNIQFRN